MAKTILVFDFGASSARAMLCRFDNGKLSLEEIHRFANTPVTEDGHLRWNTDELFEQMKTGISFGVFAGGFDAISIDTWGVDFGLIDMDGNLLEKPVHYRDSRTDGIPEEVYKIVSAKDMFMQSGIQPQNINTVFQLAYLSMVEKNTVFRAEKMLMMPDLFAYMLTGECRSEFTEATTSQLVLAGTKEWNQKLIVALGIPKRIFCPIILPGEEYGKLKYELAEEFRCEQVPVIACPSHDTASAVLAVPSREEGFVFVSCGTWTLFGTELKKPIVSDKALEMGLTNEGGYGGTTTLLKNIMGLWLIQESRRYYNKNGADYSFADLENAARESKPFVSLINPNDPMFVAPDDMPLKIQEYCRKTGQPVPETQGEVLRCIYQSLACEFARTFESISELTETAHDKIYMIGGGTKDSLLCELTASACGVTAEAGPTEATALGNGISSLIALGEIKDVQSARQIIIDSGLTRSFRPVGHNEWIPVLARYKELVSDK
jgi:sugar (pentulose or hexulose) kinase